ncbi:MAG: HlyD family type I secretion periplasmic adaptor subunit [Rhodobacteraceae bacterium]|nr:HlyD family type I secretion periplasmic adaptor subunit [Paracoccaceae bacterium]
MKTLVKPSQNRALSARLPLSVGFLGLFLLVVGFGGWSVATNIAGAIIVPGHLEVKENRQVVQHPSGGVIGEIFVREGSVVKAGDILLRLDDASLKSELAVIDSQYFELIARRGRLEAERDEAEAIRFDPIIVDASKTNPRVREMMEGQVRLFVARRDSQLRESQQLAERKVQISAQIDGLKAQHEAQERQLELIGQELADQQKLLDKGLAQASRVSSLLREEARLAGVMGEVKASMAEAAGRIIENDIGILRLGTSRREDAITSLRDLRNRELELYERRVLVLDNLSRLDIRAPVSGAVYGMTVNAIRSVIRPAEPVMYIVPLDLPLVIASRIDTIHIDQVHLGQDVTLRFSTFDQRTTPELFGKVVKLSADAFVDEATRSSYYRAEIQPNPEELDKLKGLDLLPGMPVEGFIRTDDRTPLSYLLKPMTNYFKKAFRE